MKYYRTQEYNTKHKWINSHFGKARSCCNCDNTTDKRYHWANISKTYKKDRSDWINLCAYCHWSYDNKGKLPTWELD